MITNPCPMELMMSGNDELPARIPDWTVWNRQTTNVLLLRRIPSMTLSCGYVLQFPELELPPIPLRERSRSRNKYAVPHQSTKERTRRLNNVR